MGKARSAAAGYGRRRADLEPLVRLLVDVLALAAVLRRRSRESGRPGSTEEERP
jgi:hypothetical protein